MEEVKKHFGGPARFLEVELLQESQATTLENFLFWVDSQIPVDDEIMYHEKNELVWVASENDLPTVAPMAFRLGAIGIHKETSHKPAPGKKVFGELASEILVDGMVTASEPLILRQPSELSALVNPQNGQSEGHP